MPCFDFSKVLTQRSQNHRSILIGNSHHIGINFNFWPQDGSKVIDLACLIASLHGQNTGISRTLITIMTAFILSKGYMQNLHFTFVTVCIMQFPIRFGEWRAERNEWSEPS